MQIKKGQAALEFLFTYSWAILVLVIVFGILFSTSLFNRSNFVKQECFSQPDFPCNSHYFNGTHHFIEFSNSFGHNVNITSARSFLVNRGGDEILFSNNLKVVDPIEYELNGYLFEKGNTIVIEGINNTFNEISSSDIVEFRLKIKYNNCAVEINPGCVNADRYIHDLIIKSIVKVS